MKRIADVPETEKDLVGLLTFSLMEVKLRLELTRQQAKAGRPLTSDEEESVANTIEGMRDDYSAMAFDRLREVGFAISWKSFGFNVLCGALGNVAFGVAVLLFWAIFHLPSLKDFLLKLFD